MATKITTRLELDALPAGSVIASGMADVEGNIFEKAHTNEGDWLLTGETSAFSSAEIAEWADYPFTVLRFGLGKQDGEPKNTMKALYRERLRNLKERALGDEAYTVLKDRLDSPADVR